MPISPTRRLTTLALLSAVGTSLFVLEAFIPSPFPFIRIGLANVSALVALLVFSPKDMLIVAIVRVIAGSLLTGTLLTPSFLLSLSGGVTSALAMAAAKAIGSGVFGPVGISLFGSVAHVLTQLFLVMTLFVKNQSLLLLLPVLLTSAILGGVVVGWISARMVGVIRVVQDRSG